MVPPRAVTMRTSFRSTSPLGFMMRVTASTAIGARRSEFCEITFELSDVMAAFINVSRSSMSIFTLISSRTRSACCAHSWKHSEIIVGWMPFIRSSSTAFRRAPHKTTTDVVPSPASTSWALDSSTSILAHGCVTCNLLTIVAPSLEITTSPFGSMIILSIPRGPSDVRTQSATALAAEMLLRRVSMDFSLPCFVSFPFGGMI
mmetsp:Transcript_23691/g.27421  ORF Transcript_23691/g.27421 Transcript_23691/m.27421 type:complete len:203 (-) Transcript_23691:31-639(-)